MEHDSLILFFFYMALSKIDSNFVKIVLTTAFKTKVGLEVIRGFELNEIFKFVF